MRLRKTKYPALEIWNECTGCMCHEMNMAFGTAENCAECGCPVTDEEFLKFARPIARTKHEWKTQKV